VPACKYLNDKLIRSACRPLEHCIRHQAASWSLQAWNLRHDVLLHTVHNKVESDFESDLQQYFVSLQAMSAVQSVTDLFSAVDGRDGCRHLLRWRRSLRCCGDGHPEERAVGALREPTLRGCSDGRSERPIAGWGGRSRRRSCRTRGLSGVEDGEPSRGRSRRRRGSWVALHRRGEADWGPRFTWRR
jgi:hypothetical protein